MAIGDTVRGISPADLQAILNLIQSTTRWGIATEPSWVFADAVAAPGVGAVLVTKAVSAGKHGYIYGFFLMASEGNSFLINWTSGGVAKSLRLIFTGPNSIESIDPTAMNNALLADPGTNITITNITVAGVGTTYQAAILYAEI